MLYQSNIEKPPPSHAIVCHFLLNDTGGEGLGDKNDQVRHNEKKGSKKRFFAIDVRFE